MEMATQIELDGIKGLAKDLKGRFFLESSNSFEY